MLKSSSENYTPTPTHLIGKLILFFILVISIGSIALAQNSSSTLWKNTSESEIKSSTATRYIFPAKYRTVSSDIIDIRKALAAAPMEVIGNQASGRPVITVPFPDGTNREFYVTESPVMAPELSAKYPRLKTYSVDGLSASSCSGRIDCTPLGFHAMIFTPAGMVFVDPY